MISYASWDNRFGRDPNIIDTSIRLDDRPYTVVGVMPAEFEFPPSDADAEAWLPLETLIDGQRPRAHRMFNVVGLLNEGSTVEQARQERNTISVDIDPGFRKSNVVSTVVSLPRSRYSGREPQKHFFADLVERVNALPDVRSAGAVSALPMSAVGTDFNLPFTPPGQEIASPGERPRAGTRIVMAGYFKAMGIPLIEGRILDEFDGLEDGRRGTVINETMARLYFREVEPIGQMLAVPMMGDLEIVGIVGDV